MAFSELHGHIVFPSLRNRFPSPFWKFESNLVTWVASRRPGTPGEQTTASTAFCLFSRFNSRLRHSHRALCRGQAEGRGLHPGFSPQGTRWPWTCPLCITTARCCGTRCPCWATASMGTSSRTARGSGGWVSSDTTSQVTQSNMPGASTHGLRLAPGGASFTDGNQGARV